MMRETIRFIGLGNIGKPMATHIARAGFDMVVYDIGGTVERAPDGAMAGTSAAVVTRRSTAIFLSLPTVEAVAADHGGGVHGSVFMAFADVVCGTVSYRDAGGPGSLQRGWRASLCTLGRVGHLRCTLSVTSLITCSPLFGVSLRLAAIVLLPRPPFAEIDPVPRRVL